MTTIRTERPGDAPAIRRVNEAAFGQPDEADIVDALRQACPDSLSLVAVADDGSVVGHILFTPAVVEGEGHGVTEAEGRQVVGVGLAPMAVLPERQRQGIGSKLVTEGLEMLRGEGCPFVIVLGHPDFYPRFGFVRASGQGLACQWQDVPDEAFMVLVLDADVMRGVSGVARYREEFSEVV